MAGAVMNPVSISVSQTPSPSPLYFNSCRISSAVDRLLAHVFGGSKNDNNEFSNLCLSLSRGIDYAVGNNVIPDRASELPRLLKQVCQWTHDSLLRASVMVLMISIKGASKNGWFSEKDNDELNILWKEIANSFRSVRDMNSGESTFHQSILEVMSRFYPRMKMGEILTFVEAMPGYGAYVEDFHITKNAKSPQEKLYLFVAQTEDTDTSACIISPQQVIFLLNGKGVDGRTCIYKDPGPQIPTMVENIVKYGSSNLLQAIGNFNGKYIIVVAFMSMVSNPSCPTLPDYVLPVAAASDSDNEIIEGPSRISLNCPISFKRIKTPVKGHLCNHLQCFDFDNYVYINSKRPSWRCPHCSQSVCFSDIRIDQGMVKVLKEVVENVSHVKFSGEGSWETVIEGDNHADKPLDKSPLHQESSISRDPGADILDLTIEDKEMDASNSRQENDKKPSPAQLQNVITNAISQGQSQLSASNNIQLPTHASGTSNTRSNVTVSAPVLDNFVNGISQGQSQINAFNSIQSQQHNSNNMSNEYVGRYPTPARYVTRIPIAVQALPAQTSLGIVSSDRQQQFSTSQMDQHPLMRMVSALPSQNTASQNWVHHDRLNVASQLVQQFGAYPDPPQQSSGYSFNSHQQHSFNQIIQNSPQSLSPQFLQGVVGPTTGLVSNQHGYHYSVATAQQAIQNSSWTSPVTTPLQTSASSMQTMRMALLEEQQIVELNKQISSSLQLTNKTDNHVGFKVKTTIPKKYCVRPNTGVVLPRSTCEVIVTMQAQKDAPPDMQCKDKFLLQSVIASPGATPKDITPEMFAKGSGNTVEECKLRVVYFPATPSTSAITQRTEEVFSPIDKGNLSGSEVSKTFVESDEKSSDVRSIISKLTDEKNTAIEQSKRIRQELELLKRGSNKSQLGGASLIFVIIVALIGLILGYIMKK